MPDAPTTLPVTLDGLGVAITAGANGIGRAIADSFRAAGAHPFICDLDEAELARSGHAGRRADAARATDMEAFIDAAIAHLGRLDVLVNNAGIAGPTAPVEQIDEATLEQVLAIDLKAMFHCARRAVPALKAAGGGSIINLSSVAGRFGFALRSPYSAAKWGVIGLTKSLSIELGPANIRVNAILPGAVAGDRLERVLAAKARSGGISIAEQRQRQVAAASLGKFVSAQDIANLALYLASPFGATISGQAIGVDADLQYMM
ncbi:MAG: SDR family oxidoreductase [Acetobacteraceae bacterium]